MGPFPVNLFVTHAFGHHSTSHVCCVLGTLVGTRACLPTGRAALLSACLFVHLSVLLFCREVSCDMALRVPSLCRIYLPTAHLSNRRRSPWPPHVRLGPSSHRQRQRRRIPSQHLQPAVSCCTAALRMSLAKLLGSVPATRAVPTPATTQSCPRCTSSQGARAWPCGRGGSAGVGGRASAQTRASNE